MPNISILDEIVRPILVYGFLLIALRLGGKRDLGAPATHSPHCPSPL
jgi:uncharacterized membrane protein YcaP (DUF421 family)